MISRLATMVGLGLWATLAALGLLPGCGSSAPSTSSSSAAQTATATAAVPDAIPVEVIAVGRQPIASHLQGTATSSTKLAS